MSVLIITDWFWFTQAGWLPLVPCGLALIIASGVVVTYTSYKSQQEQIKIRRKVQEQEKSLALLKSLLKKNHNRQSRRVKDKTNYILARRYKLTKKLGAGGFSRTYLARDLQRPGQPYCVVKRLKPASNNANFLLVARRLFNTEAEILEKLGNHEQIPLLLAYLEEDGEFYLIEEFVAGHTLSKELIPDEKLSEKIVIQLLKEILKTLSFIQKYYIIHRDIKPANIIRRKSDNHLVLIDFGAVKQITPPYITNEGEDSTVVIGTKGYAPPEQLTGQPLMSSDIYATGMIAIQALTGIHPQQLRRDQTTARVMWRSEAEVSQE